jgi:hypothetical protein
VRATTFLRPIHAWFRLWDAFAGPVARLVAVAVGAVLTAGALVFAGVPGPIAVVFALASWIGLAVAQEHDGRARLPADPAFAAALAAAVAEPPLRLVVTSASGPPRARAGEPDVYVLAPDEAGERHPFAGWYVEVRRDRDEVGLSAGPDDERGGDHLGATWSSIDAVADAGAVATALRRSSGRHGTEPVPP